MNRKKQILIEILEETGERLFPREISKKTKEKLPPDGIKEPTVRGYLRELARDGHIFCDEAHRYCSKTTYGVVSPLLIHNLRFKVVASWLRDMRKVEDEDESFGGAHLRVQYGKRNGLITGGVAYDRGLDQAHVLMLLTRFHNLIERKTGHKIDRFLVTTLEWNRDYVGLRLDNRDGLRCFTLKEFEDFLTRVYQKENNIVRAETKCSRELAVEELLEIQRGGSLGFVRDLTVVSKLREDMQRLIEVNRFFNLRIDVLERSHSKITEAFLNMANLVKKQSGEYSELRDVLLTLIGWRERSEAEGLKKAQSYRS